MEHEAPKDERQFIQFPEDQISGDGFTQLDPKTGWLWIGIKLHKFSFRDAWAFLKSQEYMVSSYMTQKENENMMRARLAAAPHKEKAGIAAFAKKLGITV